jgi:hypothetical protein
MYVTIHNPESLWHQEAISYGGKNPFLAIPNNPNTSVCCVRAPGPGEAYFIFTAYNTV